MTNPGKTVFAQLTKARSIHGGFGFLKWKKKAFPLLTIDFKFFDRDFANPCSM
jgi:hypothetical protein